MLFLAGRGPNWILSGLGSTNLSSADPERSEVSGGLLVASLRGGVGTYEILSASDMKVDVDAVFGRWMVAGWATLFGRGGEVSGIINGGAMASVGGFLRGIRKGGGRGDTRGEDIGVEVGSVGGSGREKRREGGTEDESARVVYEEWERKGRGGSGWVVSRALAI